MSDQHDKQRFVASMVADDIEARIRDGEFRPHEVLPDPWALANEYGVWFETFQSAARLLTIRDLVTVAPSLALRVTRHARTSTVSMYGRQRRLRSAIDHEVGPLLDASDRGDHRARQHLLAIGTLLVRRGSRYIGASGLDAGGLKHELGIVLRDGGLGAAGPEDN